MTPAQLLQRLPAEQSPLSDDILPCAAGAHYTSEAMEEDFSTSVELLMLTPKFLDYLRDADDHYQLFDDKSRQLLDEHLSTIQDFTGQWLND